MKYPYFVATFGCIAFGMSFSALKAQTKAILFDGIVTAGYVDRGAFMNCAGPGLKATAKPYMFMLGLLPSLRIKEDNAAAGATKNKMLTPNLGFGFTAAYRRITFQIPLYYNAKTTTQNGAWKAGVGLGYKFSSI